MKTRPKVQFVAAFFICTGLLAFEASAGMFTPQRTSTTYRDLVSMGARPEIISCLLDVKDFVKLDPQFESVIWSDQDLLEARMIEQESSNSFKREVQFTAQFRVKNKNSIFSSWKRQTVSCVRVDDAAPLISISESK
jgi:hypothetical protein